MEAIRIRALQTELMVAGLSCNGKKHYNHFVRDHRSELKEYAEALRGYFRRVYGSGGEMELNKFVTRLANEMSTRSMQSARDFCENARDQFESTESEAKLQNVDYRYRGEIRACRY